MNRLCTLFVVFVSLSASATFGPISDEPVFRGDAQWHIRATRTDKAWALLKNRNIVPGAGVLIAHPDSGYSAHVEIPLSTDDKSGGVVLEGAYDFINKQEFALDDLRFGDGLLSAPGHGVQALSLMISPDDSTDEMSVVGTAPGARVLPLKTSSGIFVTNPEALTAAIYHAIEKDVDVIAMSQGTPFMSLELSTALRIAERKGIILIAAAGNATPFVVFPAAYPSVIAVAATNEFDEPSWFSAFGADIDVALPGENIQTAYIGRDPLSGMHSQDVGATSGTTLATGQLAGIAAMWISHHGRDFLRARYGERLPSVFEALLKSSSRKPTNWRSDVYGSGIVDAYALLLAELPQ